MPRTARKKALSKTYHVVLRGINKQTIFFDDEDKIVFLNRIKLAKEKKDYKLYAFCLMSNHVHLLIKEEDTPLGNIFRMILSSYVHWYNQKYKRIGNLFQDRFRSDAITDDAHLLCALRYIHQNPVKAGMAISMQEYRWSSHSAYTAQGDGGVVLNFTPEPTAQHPRPLVLSVHPQAAFLDTSFILSILGGTREYSNFVSQEEYIEFAENDNKTAVTDEDLDAEIKKIMRLKNISNLNQCDKKQIKDIIISLRQTTKGASLRQISKITGIPVSTIRYIR